MMRTNRIEEVPGNREHGSKLEESSVDMEKATQWRGLWICALISYFTTSMGQTLAVSGWPYLRTIDPSVPITFLGYVQALTKCGHAVGACAFAIHAYTYKSFKKSLIIGRVLSAAGCVFYICIELFASSHRRYAYMVKFLLQSIAEGSLVVIRSYVPRMSKESDRQRAFSVIGAANMLAIVTGPMVQLACHLLPENGPSLFFPWLKFNMFTVPIWISLILNLVTLYIAFFHFREPELNEMEDQNQLPLGPTIRRAWKQIKKLDRNLVIMCFIEKSFSSYGFAAMYTSMSLYVTETLNVSESRALFILSGTQTVVGMISLATVAVFILTPLARVVRASYLFPFALSSYFFMYFLSYPWSIISEEIPLRNNVTSPYGCDASRYSWCGEALYIADHRFWIGTVSLFYGIGIPVSTIAFDTIYSRVLGAIDQNVMQGVLIIVDDFTLAGAPLISTKSFDTFGPGPLWLSVSGICLVGILLFLPIIPKLRRMHI